MPPHPPISTERQAREVSCPPPSPLSPLRENKKQDSAQKKKPRGILLYLSLLCRLLPPSSLSCLILSE